MTMSERWKEGDYLFDGFAHRSYNESIDGWRNAIPNPSDFPAVVQAQAVIDLYDALCEARVQNWRLQKEVEQLRPLLHAYVGTGST